MKEEWHPCMHDVADNLDVTKCLIALRKKDGRRFHSPAHKGRGHFLAEILDIRLDEKNVVEAESKLPVFEKKMNEIYGGKASFVSTNGTSAASLSVISALSLFGGIALFRSSPSYLFDAFSLFRLEPKILPDDLPEEELEKALSGVSSVLVASPDIINGVEKNDRLFSVAKKLGKKIALFSEYGGNYVFSEKFPDYAFDKKCDLAVFAIDNVLPSFCGSTLTVAYSDELKKALEPLCKRAAVDFKTIMSMEYGAYVYKAFPEAIDELEKNSSMMKRTLEASDFSLVETPCFALVINAKCMGISGKELEARLQDMGIYPEYADIEKVFFTISTEDEKEEITHLTRDLIVAAEQCGQISEKAYKKPQKPKRAAGFIESFYGDGELVDLEESVGRIAASSVFHANVKTPIILAGEIITKDIVEYLETPLDFEGVSNDKIKVLK